MWVPLPYIRTQFIYPSFRSRVTHLEGKLAISADLGYSVYQTGHAELCFWLFVVNLGPTQKDWFGSLYFKTWIVGSGIAVLYMPLVTIVTRSDPLKVPFCDSATVNTSDLTFHLLKCEAYTFMAGSLGSLCLTLWFLPVL
jgi:hypothetical protein